MKPEIEHVIVLMLENRSFDSMLGRLYPKLDTFDGLSDDESNSFQGKTYKVWTTQHDTPSPFTIPTPDPNEDFVDMEEQIYGNDHRPWMGGFVSNYAKANPTTPGDIMHGFTEAELPVLSQLAKAFGVSDRWHASTPNQTWPNRFFLHAATALGYLNNSPTHFPYVMPTVFNRMTEAGKSWRIYFHDVPQTATLANLWSELPDHLYRFDEHFELDAKTGHLPNYSFIEPRYFSDPVTGHMPNDQHPPHDVRYGEQLIATCYNAIRRGPGWEKSLFIIIYDEHGGIYDHVRPPKATPPDDHKQEGFTFDIFGVRVPAVIISPWIPKGSIIRPPEGGPPYDHTSVIKTLRTLFGFPKLTNRDEAAPDLMDCLSLPGPSNNGPDRIDPPVKKATQKEIRQAHAAPPNGMQKALAHLATNLPKGSAPVQAPPSTVPNTAGEALKTAKTGLAGFLKPGPNHLPAPVAPATKSQPTWKPAK